MPFPATRMRRLRSNDTFRVPWSAKPSSHQPT